MKKLHFIFWVLVGSALATLMPRRKIPISKFSQANRLSIMHGTSLFEHNTFSIEDPQTINAVVELIVPPNVRWRLPWHTVPGGEFTIWFYQDERFIQSFFIARNVIVASEGNANYLLRSVPPASNDQLRMLVGLPPYKNSCAIASD